MNNIFCKDSHGRRDISKVINNSYEYLNFKSVSGRYFVCDCTSCGSKDVLIPIKNMYRLSIRRPTSCRKCRPHLANSNNHCWSGYEGVAGKILTVLKRDAASRNYSFEIENSDIWDKYIGQDKKCIITGEDIEFPNKSKCKIMNNNGRASVDRINNKIGYTVDNIWIVHRDFNFYKWKLSLDELYYYSNKIANPVSDYGIENTIKDIPIWLWNSTVRNQEKKGISPTANKDDIIEIFNKQNGKCFYTGVNIEFAKKVDCRALQTASIDRIDSKAGYVKDNIVICHKMINMMKGVLSIDRMKFLAKKTVQRLEELNLIKI